MFLMFFTFFLLFVFFSLFLLCLFFCFLFFFKVSKRRKCLEIRFFCLSDLHIFLISASPKCGKGKVTGNYRDKRNVILYLYITELCLYITKLYLYIKKLCLYSCVREHICCCFLTSCVLTDLHLPMPQRCFSR